MGSVFGRKNTYVKIPTSVKDVTYYCCIFDHTWLASDCNIVEEGNLKLSHKFLRAPLLDETEFWVLVLIFPLSKD